MNDIGSYVFGEALSQAIDWGKTHITDIAKQKRLETLIRETSERAAMNPNAAVLTKRFESAALIEELLAHHDMLDISKDDAIARFLGDDANDDATTFVKEFWEEVSRIKATAPESLASRTAAENTLAILDELRLSNKEPVEGQIALLEDLTKTIATEDVDVERLQDLSKSSGHSLSASFLKAYCALCTGSPASFEEVEQIKGNDILAEALCSASLSARRLEDVKAASQFFSFDATSLLRAMEKLLTAPPKQVEGQTISIPEGKDVNGLVNLVNLAHWFDLKAFHIVNEYADNNYVSWNPIAREKLATSRLMASIARNDGRLKERTIEYINRYRNWFPDELVTQHEQTVSIALMLLSEDDALDALSCMPPRCSHFVQEEKMAISLRFCDDPDAACDAAIWAEARQNPDLLMMASIRAIELDESKRSSMAEIYERNLSWALSIPGSFPFYVMEINPGISYDSFLKLGKARSENAIYHLIAYRKFADDKPVEAISHIERAIQLMKPPKGAPELLYSDIWVPYLISNGRSEEIPKLVKGVLPSAPAGLLKPFLNALISNANGELIKLVIDSVIESDFNDPVSAETIAEFLAGSGKMELAGRLALKGAAKQPSETLAEIAIHWQLQSSLDIDNEIISYAKSRDSNRMNLLLAYVEHENGSTQLCNSYLVRASFGREEACSHALMQYAIWNAGTSDDSVPNEVSPDCYVKLRLENGAHETVFFFSEKHVVKSEGAKGPAGIAHTTASGVFTRLRGNRPGDQVQYDGMQADVEEIGTAASCLIKTGFKEMIRNENGVAITGSPDELFDKLSEMAERSNDQLDFYLNGVETDSNTIYFGIETIGCIIGRSRQLEFMIRAIVDPSAPLRRASTSRNYAASKEEAFLLSYNAVIVLSLLDLPSEIVSRIQSRCALTSSTAKRLKKDARSFAEEPYTGIGRLTFKDGNPVYYEYDDVSKHETKTRSLTILDLVDCVGVVDPSLEAPSQDLRRVLSDNEVIDVQTAEERDLVFVTEDIMEAALIDGFNIGKRCSISSMLISLECIEYALGEFASQMRSWNAVPYIEDDIFRAVKDTAAAFGIANLEDE